MHNQKTSQENQSRSSAPASQAGGSASTSSSRSLSRLGYNFPHHVTHNKFFDTFIAGFKNSGVHAFTPLQCQMLDELIHNRSFQVTSPDVSCGSGKTSLTVAATIGLFQDNDKIIFVNKPGRGESSLTRELKQLVEKYSGGPSMMRVSTVLNDMDAEDHIPKSDIVITNCIALNGVLRTLTSVQDLALHSPRKIYIIFDEAHKIFNHHGLERMGEWTILQERRDGIPSTTPCQPYMSHIAMALSNLYKSSMNQPNLISIPIFLSAVGDFSVTNSHPGRAAECKVLSTSDIVEMTISHWLKIPVTKLINTGNNSERNYNCIYKIHREGAIQIGGVDQFGFPLVYEAMMKIALNRLVDGRMLFIVRRQQVETFSTMLDERIAESGRFFSYTTDRNYWNAIDKETLKPLYNIVIVREDELDDLEGVNIDGLSAVYLFSLGKTKNLYQKMQGLGRVGRLGQEASYCFVMIDCATKRNGAIEAESSPFLLEAMNSNGTCRPQIIEVKGAKALDIVSNIPHFSPNFEKPTPLQLDIIKKTIRKANRPQVCKFMRYCRKQAAYICPSIQQGYKCAWYHPKPGDFAPRTHSLRCCSFNISYCKKGVFHEARCSCINSMVPIAPVTSTAAAWQGTNPVLSSVLCLSQFPKLEKNATIIAVDDSESIECSNITSTPPGPEGDDFHSNSSRMERPVCRFAVIDMYKCRSRREGKLCYFRHPEETEDRVTDDEYMDALRVSITNLNKARVKHGQKSIPFREDLYSKYNYPGRFKSNLVKAEFNARAKCTGKHSAKPAAKTLASVLSEENDEPSKNGNLFPIFSALRNAFDKKNQGIAKVAPLPLPQSGMISSIETSTTTGIDSNYKNFDESFAEVTSKNNIRKSSESTHSSHQCTGSFFDLLACDSDSDDVDSGDDNEVEISTLLKEEITIHEDHESRHAEKNIDGYTSPIPSNFSGNLSHKECNDVVKGAMLSGVEGSLLVQFLQESCRNEPTTTASALAAAILSRQEVRSFRYEIFSDDEFGLGLKYLLNLPSSSETRISGQADLLETVEIFCGNQDFVKVEVKSGQKYFIDVIFRLLYAYELVDEQGFFEWHERSDFKDVSREDIKLKAILQTTEFFGWLLQDEESADVSYSDERHVSCTTIETHIPCSEQKPEHELSKAERKALKQQRRQEKVANRMDPQHSKLPYIGSSFDLTAMTQ